MAESEWSAVKIGGRFRKDEIIPVSVDNIKELVDSSKIRGYMPTTRIGEYRDKRNDKEKNLFLMGFEENWERYKSNLLLKG